MDVALQEKNVWSIASVNIQAGLSTHSYRDYITKSWNHVTPLTAKKYQSLSAICNEIKRFDFVGIQEVDPGSVRSGFQNQALWLAERGVFDYWACQKNRRTGFSTTANALYSHHHMSNVEHWVLPSRKSSNASRGALKAIITHPHTQEKVCCVVAHLSLNAQDQRAQSSFLAERLQDEKHLIVVGDFNQVPSHSSLAPLRNVMDGHTTSPTFPRWNPQKAIDLIWWKGASPVSSKVHAWGATDHCGIELNFSLV